MFICSVYRSSYPMLCVSFECVRFRCRNRRGHGCKMWKFQLRLLLFLQIPLSWLDDTCTLLHIPLSPLAVFHCVYRFTYTWTISMTFGDDNARWVRTLLAFFMQIHSHCWHEPEKSHPNGENSRESSLNKQRREILVDIPSSDFIPTTYFPLKELLCACMSSGIVYRIAYFDLIPLL